MRTRGEVWCVDHGMCDLESVEWNGAGVAILLGLSCEL